MQKKFLADLAIEDYSEGPLPETFYGGSEMGYLAKRLNAMKYTLRSPLAAPATQRFASRFILLSTQWSIH